jgi:outer membrane protein insertion porin family
LVAEVAVKGTDNPALVREVYEAIGTQAGQSTTRSQLQADINAVFATGFFADVEAVPSDTPLGVRVTYTVRPNPLVKSVRTEGATVIPDEVLEEIFGPQQGKVLNYGKLQQGVDQLEAWYADNGYVLASVSDVRSTPDGSVVLVVSEGVIEDIRVAGNTKTRDFIVTRELSTTSGEVFNRNRMQKDLQKVFALNLFQDVNLSLNPGKDPSKVIATVNVEERSTGSLSAGGGVSSSSGLFGSVSLTEQNLGGNNQDLGLDVQVGTEELLFDINFSDPRIAQWETPTSFNTSIFNRISNNVVYDDDQDIVRLGSNFTFVRPIGGNWRASYGAQQQFVSISDGEDDSPLTLDGAANSLSSLRLGLVNDRRNDPLRPARGSVFRISTDQSVGIFQDGLTRNKPEISYSQFVPVNFTQFSDSSPEALAFDVRSGTMLGDVAPFDAFVLGGGNTVRGFEEGRVGTGKSFAQASAEYRFPILNFLGGVLFMDYGTDLGSAAEVLGNPTESQDLLGSAYGLGAGLRIQSPLGAVRVDYGFGQGEDGGRFHFGIGEKF